MNERNQPDYRWVESSGTGWVINPPCGHSFALSADGKQTNRQTQTTETNYNFCHHSLVMNCFHMSSLHLLTHSTLTGFTPALLPNDFYASLCVKCIINFKVTQNKEYTERRKTRTAASVSLLKQLSEAILHTHTHTHTQTEWNGTNQSSFGTHHHSHSLLYIYAYVPIPNTRIQTAIRDSIHFLMETRSNTYFFQMTQFMKNNQFRNLSILIKFIFISSIPSAHSIPISFFIFFFFFFLYDTIQSLAHARERIHSVQYFSWSRAMAGGERDNSMRKINHIHIEWNGLFTSAHPPHAHTHSPSHPPHVLWRKNCWTN